MHVAPHTCACLHEEEDNLAGQVAADAVHVHVAPPSHPAGTRTRVRGWAEWAGGRKARMQASPSC